LFQALESCVVVALLGMPSIKESRRLMIHLLCAGGRTWTDLKARNFDSDQPMM